VFSLHYETQGTILFEYFCSLQFGFVVVVFGFCCGSGDFFGGTGV
jgi:hypothetical protein